MPSFELQPIYSICHSNSKPIISHVGVIIAIIHISIHSTINSFYTIINEPKTFDLNIQNGSNNSHTVLYMCKQRSGARNEEKYKPTKNNE